MLYIIATPIGNLKDISLRALDILKQVDFILCEDTRVSIKLLAHYEIKKRLISYHHHTTDKKVKELIKIIKNNKVALITDAGTPGISDPGNKIIESLVKEGIEDIVAIPGASAVIMALSLSGFPTDQFLFLGFAPHKKGKNKFLKEVIENKRTVVFYESPHRIVKTLDKLKKLEIELGCNKEVVVCRELTKKFETIYRGTLDSVLYKVEQDPIKGEYTVVVH